MDRFCRHHFDVREDKDRIRDAMARLRQEQHAVRARLLDMMNTTGHKNVQVEAADGTRFQVKLGRYDVPKVITVDVLDNAAINWAAASSLSFADFVAHVIAEVKKVARDSRRYVDVAECGKRSRNKLLLVGGSAAVATGSAAAIDPFVCDVVRLAGTKDMLRAETQRLAALVHTPEEKAAAAETLSEMTTLGLKRRAVNMRRGDQDNRYEILRKEEWRRPTVTVKNIVAAVTTAVEEQLANKSTFSPAAVKQRILDLILQATKPVLHESVHFKPVREAVQ